MPEKKGNVLVLGAGNSHQHRLILNNQTPPGRNFEDNFEKVVTVDFDEACNPDVYWDLTKTPWPLPFNYFDEVHAYELLEHLVQAGDYQAFFTLWKQIWDVMKPGGFFAGTTPKWDSQWAWSDPGHRMVYSRLLLVYLDQNEYARQIGVTAMTDYRRVWHPPYSFTVVYSNEAEPEAVGFQFVLRKEVYERPHKA